GGVGEGWLDQAVLAWVVREHRAAPAGGEHLDGLVEGGAEHLELLVDLDAHRLEGAPGRVPTPAPGRRGNGRPDDVGQLARRRDRAGFGDGPGDADREALVAVAAQDGGQALGRVRVDDVGGGGGLAAVHAHVERGV